MAFVPSASSVDVNGFYGSGSSVDIGYGPNMLQGVLGFFGAGQRQPYQSSMAPMHQVPRTDTEVYEEEMSERDKVLDQHVVYYLKNHPEFYDLHNLVRVRESVYKIDGREISVDWHHPDSDHEAGYLLVIDGNIRQPFADYVQGTGLNIERLDKRGRKVESARYKEPAEPPAAAPAQAQTHGTPVYCCNHDTSDKRKKTKPRELACTSCGESIQTNYLEFSLCPSCSNAKQRCMCCGHSTHAKDAFQGINLNATLKNLEVTSPYTKQGQPVYCARHNQSSMRKKTKPRDMDCTCCGKSIQTNYVDFTLCPNCSNDQQRCMCCGDAASSANANALNAAARTASQNIYAPRQNRLSTTSQPPPSTRGSGIGGLLSSAWPTGLFSSPPPASQDRYNAYASQKPLSAQNRGLSFVSQAPSCHPMATYNVMNPMASQRRF
jgi:hypothetical protein